MNSVIRKPYLVFNYVIKTHQFNPSQFFNPIPQVREKLHHEIDILHQLGWGYTKIHHHLVNNGFKIGESRTTVDKILKKMKKRETFLTQPIMDGFTEYSVEVYESWNTIPKIKIVLSVKVMIVQMMKWILSVGWIVWITLKVRKDPQRIGYTDG